MLLVLVVHRYALGAGFAGADTYGILARSVVRAPADLPGLFRQQLMDGLRFYRPLLHATLAVDHALFGLDARGYQVMSLLWFAACVTALGALAGRLAGPQARLAPLVAVLAFVLYPVQYQIVPVLARRAEVLCCLFLALAMRAQLAPRRLARHACVAPALLGLLAALSKDTGLVAPLLAFVLVALYSPRPDRWRHALLASLPFVLAAGLALAARFVVLGGMGGHPGAGLRPLDALGLGRTLLFPVRPMEAHALSTSLLVTLGISLLAVVARRGIPPGPGPIRAALFATLWTGGMLVLHASAGPLRSWYMLLPAAGLALLAGSLMEAVVVTLREPAPAMRRVAAAILAAALVILLGWQWRYSPPIARYDKWQASHAVTARYLAATEEQLLAAPAGTIVRQEPREARLAAPSIQGWADLVFPDRIIRVVEPRDGEPIAAGPEEVVLVVARSRRSRPQ